MRNKDTIMLEEAYTNIVSEMAYRPTMPKFSKIPSVTKVTNVSKNEQESEERKVAAGLKINENLQLLEKDPNNIAAAWDIINILNNFEKERDEFLVGDEEMSYQEILEKVLKLTTTESNDPSLLKVEKDPVTFEEKPALTIDEYLSQWNPKTKQKEKIEGRDAEHYYLFRALFKALPDMEAKVRSRREKTYEGSTSQDVFYFAKRYKVTVDGDDVGFYEPGVGFYPNDEGIKKGFYDNNLLDKKGYYGITTRAWKTFKADRKVDISDMEVLPYRTSVFVPPTGRFDKTLFWETNRRIPRRKSEPIYAPAPMPFDRYRPADLVGQTLEEVRFAVNSYEAEEEFRKLYPEDKYPFLYKHGKVAGKVEDEQAETVQTPSPEAEATTPEA